MVQLMDLLDDIINLLLMQYIGPLERTVLSYTCVNLRKKVGKRVLKKHDVCDWSAAGGYMDVLKWACSIGCEIGSHTLGEAIKNGHLEICSWLYKFYDNGQRYIHFSSITYAISAGHDDVVRWAASTGYRFGEQEGEETVNKNNMSLFEFMIKSGLKPRLSIFSRIAKQNQIEMLKCLREHSIDISHFRFFAVEYGSIEMVELLHSYGYGPHRFDVLWAASGGNLEIVKCLHCLGVSWDILEYNAANRSGRTAVVEWMLENATSANPEVYALKLNADAQ